MKHADIKNQVLVQFLIDEEGDVFAYFPEVKEGEGMRMSYATIGQHSACSIEYADNCRSASEFEYAKLLQELHFIGYDNLQIID